MPTLVSVAVAVTFLSSCTLAAVTPTARCSLVMHGHAQAPMVNSNPPQAGLKQMKLSCVSSPAGWKVPVGVSKMYTRQFVGAFDGVEVVGNYSCQQKAETQGYNNLPGFALLYFCGDYQITLEQPHISNIYQAFESRDYDTSVLAFGGNVRAVIIEGQLVNNTAGSVVLVMDTATVRIRGGTVFGSNMGNPASGVWARDRSHVVISDSIFRQNNSTDVGGAMAAMGEANVTFITTDFESNTAAFSGGAVMSQDAAAVQFERCKFRNNTSGDTGGAVTLAGTNLTTFVLSTFISNHAKSNGGALLASQDAQLVIQDSLVMDNVAAYGGGVMATDYSQLQLLGNTDMTGNTASLNGGALVVDQSASLIMSNSCSITSNTAGGQAGGALLYNNYWTIPALQKLVHGNKAKQGNNDLSVPPTQVKILGPRRIKGFVSRPGDNQGQLPVNVTVTGQHSIPCQGSMIEALLSGNQFLASNRSDAQGTAQFMLSFRQPPGTYQIVFALADGNVSDRLSLQVRGCLRGEVQTSPGTCQICPAQTYSLNPSDTSCTPCPPNANCPGGDVIVPDVGCWHSARGSTQIHRCPNPLACQGNRDALTATEQCAAAGSNSSNGAAASSICNNNSTTNTSFNVTMQCSENYQGNLCGVCTPGTGTLRAFQCYKCLKPRVLVGLYVVAVVVLLIFIKLLCHFTLAENYKASMQTGSAESGTSPERARLEVTDLVRPLVLYMQYTLIIFSLPLELPQFLARSIQALSWLWAPASPEAFNIECLVDKEHGPVPYAVAKVLFYLCMPIAMLMALLTAEVAVRQVPKCCKQRGGSPLNIPMYRTTSSNTPKSYVDRLGSATVVVLFFFFPSIVRTLFGLFACVPIDDAVSPPFEAAAIGWFWLQDLNQQCFAGFHKTWALGLGVPLLIIVCLMLPGSILWLTLRNKSKLTGPHFVKHYGFLVRAYKPSCCFFEAVVLVQTMLLVAVSVFGLTLGAYRQGLLLNGVLGYMVLMQFVLRPHTKKQAARIVLHSYMCLFLTSYTALSFLRGSTGTFSTDPTVAAYMGAFVLVLNITFVISVLWQLVQLIEWADIKTKAQLLGEWVGRTGKNVRRRVSGGVLPKKSGGLQMSGMGTRN